MAIDPRVDIGHVHLKVSDIDRALEFWEGVLGFEIQHRYGDAKEKVKAKLDQMLHRLQGSREKAASEQKPMQPTPPTDEEKKREAA